MSCAVVLTGWIGHEMFKLFTDWLVLHPIAKDLLIGLLFLILGRISVKWSTIKSFFTVPPQKLNLWILAARLLAAEQRLKELHRLNADTRYVICQCTFALLLMAFSAVVLAATVALIVLPQSDAELNRWFSFPFDYHPHEMRVLI